jgi:hypothetical protein
MVLRAPLKLVPDLSRDEFVLDESHLDLRPNDRRVVYFGVGMGGKASNLLSLDRYSTPRSPPGRDGSVDRRRRRRALSISTRWGWSLRRPAASCV